VCGGGGCGCVGVGVSEVLWLCGGGVGLVWVGWCWVVWWGGEVVREKGTGKEGERGGEGR